MFVVAWNLVHKLIMALMWCSYHGLDVFFGLFDIGAALLTFFHYAGWQDECFHERNISAKVRDPNHKHNKMQV